ncbi:VC0807 family protein [Allokutzneria oryzae]|uniref:VC0807 family protein n=1 Tax=Allokutzneria oryzae TaxID=1378989 RepID=A0ABV5ZYI1_9PSEU
MTRPQLTVHLPSLRALAWQSGRHLLEAVLVPAGLFYLLFALTGVSGAMVAALSWSVAAVGWRLVRRTPVPAVLVITTAVLVGRTIAGLLTGSTLLYFLQPTLQNFLLAAALLASAPLRRPFLARLASDFCAFPDTLSGHPRVRRFFQQVSLLWALVFAVNGAGTLIVLIEATLGDFLVVSTAGSYTFVTLAALASLLWFRHCLRREGIVLRLGARPAGTS